MMDEMIKKFIKGTQYTNIVSPVTKLELTELHEAGEAYLDYKCIKFIPASGAATRMFKSLYQYLDDCIESDFIVEFFYNLENFAFYREIESLIQTGDIDKDTMAGRVQIIEMILKDELCYGELPKALIKMHTYEEETLTPIDEHIYEGGQYLNGNAIQLHFTISNNHEKIFNDYVEQALQDNEHIEITYSFQKKRTDTLAVDMDNQPLIDEQGDVLYRAGGHGALIENLNDLDGDIIFIKNIDNVCHKNHIEDTVSYKKKLASVGYEVKRQIDSYLSDLLSVDYDLEAIDVFIKDTLNITHKNPMTVDMALSVLNRPLRVCGMVKNQGEPGGGPFVVDNGDYLDLQICEKFEINLNDEAKLQILNDSEFFNPVDLVCFVKDYKNEKFNLLEYTNPDRYFISEKSYKGRKLKALEHPGLWNGAMHNWNTLFVEVPLSTFNPVKNVNDLLRDGHTAKTEKI